MELETRRRPPDVALPDELQRARDCVTAVIAEHVRATETKRAQLTRLAGATSAAEAARIRASTPFVNALIASAASTQSLAFAHWRLDAARLRHAEGVELDAARDVKDRIDEEYGLDEEEARCAEHEDLAFAAAVEEFESAREVAVREAAAADAHAAVEAAVEDVTAARAGVVRSGVRCGGSHVHRTRA
jgi:hypothetical protein